MYLFRLHTYAPVVQEAAEYCLVYLLNQLGQFPAPIGPSSLSALQKEPEVPRCISHQFREICIAYRSRCWRRTT
jgi:hypothetical protein